MPLCHLQRSGVVTQLRGAARLLELKASCPRQCRGPVNELQCAVPRSLATEPRPTVGIKMTGTFQCPECRQKFDSEKAKQLHWKFIHDPNRSAVACFRLLAGIRRTERKLRTLRAEAVTEQRSAAFGFAWGFAPLV
ncbi:unnamed protein product [Symbiodinium sp. CCMP2592]|nr:unnamed protein product [Symbiodinium sp. CCMP2592]